MTLLPTTIPAPSRAFPASELSLRRARLADMMLNHAPLLDLVLLTREVDLRYFTGFHTPFWQSPTRPWFLLIAGNGRSIAVIPTIGLTAMQQVFGGEIRCWSSPHPTDDGVSLLQQAIVELAGERASVGTPMGAESNLRLPLNAWADLRQGLPNLRWYDCSPLINSLTQIKSAAEIARIHHCCQLVSAVFETLPAWLTPGMTEIEIFRRFRIACLEQGVDNTDYLVGCADQGGYNDIISPPSDRQLEIGDVLMLDTGCTWQGYFCDFDRNYAIGAPDRRVADAHHRLWDATEAAIEMLKPGLTCSDIHAAMAGFLDTGSDTMKDTGVGRMGHGLGMQLTETPSIIDHDHTELRAGMVITLEPSCPVSPGRSLVHEENLVITDNGARLLTKRAPREIPVAD